MVNVINDSQTGSHNMKLTARPDVFAKLRESALLEGKIMGKVDKYNLRMARTNLKRLESRYAGFLAGRNPQFVDRLRVRQARNCVAFLESKFGV